MAQQSFLVHPSKATGENRRIELGGLDLWAFVAINNVFVYPSELNLDRFQEALAQTLALHPLASGVSIVEDDHYFVKMCDHPVPISFEENDQLNEWPLSSDVIVELKGNPLPKFVDAVQTMKVFDNVSDEPLVRFKITHLVKTGEWILGTSWSHILSDAEGCFHFLTDLSRFYQHMEPSQPLPNFERRIWSKDEADPAFENLMKQFRDAKTMDLILPAYIADAPTHEAVQLQFSGQQLKKIRALVTDGSVSTHDCLIAYLISTINRSCYSSNNENQILRTNTAVNFRGVSDSIAPKGLIGNCVMMMICENFQDPLSISCIAKTIRKSINQSRDPKYLETWLATADGMMRRNTKNQLFPDLGLFPNEIVVNSNHRYDWMGSIDFGYTDQCRFYTSWAGPLYFRVFRLNPRKNGDQWLPRDRDGATVVFRIEKDMRETFLNAIERDFQENFSNVNI